MAHFAKLDDNNVVLEVHVVNNDVITIDGVESEQEGINFLTNLFGHSNWKQTSYNGNFRKNYAGVGDTYDSVRDAFIAPRPYPSFTLNSDCVWQAPIPMPVDNDIYRWDETTQSWIKTYSFAGE
jgi:hypothetical protein